MTIIFAHRGYSAKFPENTMVAFQEAEKAGADGIELDVQLTKDGEVVVIHDEKVDRTTDGIGLVREFSYADIRKLNAGTHYKKLRKEVIPSLREVFEWLTTNELLCNIELKSIYYPYKGLEEKVISLIYEYNLSKRIILSSFNHYSIILSYRMAPEIEIAPLLAERLYMPWVYTRSICAKGFHPKYNTLTDEIIQLSIENGIAVRPYTVNKESVMKRLFHLNCSAFITDDPKKALTIKHKMANDE